MPLLGLVGSGLDPAYTAPGRRSTLLQALAEAAPAERDAHRLELARYYLSRGLAAEALGVLGSVDAPAGGAVRLVQRALSGAAELLMGRTDAAAPALGAPHLDADPEVALWRAALAAGGQDWPEAARQLERSEQVLATYPRALRVRLGLAAARAAIETGDAGLAAMLLAQLEGLELALAKDPPTDSHAKLFRRAHRQPPVCPLRSQFLLWTRRGPLLLHDDAQVLARLSDVRMIGRKELLEDAQRPLEGHPSARQISQGPQHPAQIVDPTVFGHSGSYGSNECISQVAKGDALFDSAAD